MTVQYLKTIQGGNVVADPQMTSHGEDRFRVRVRVATNWFIPGRDGAEGKQGANYFTWELWGSRARVDALLKHIHKGDGILIEGAPQNREWTDKEGQKQYGDAYIISEWKKDWGANKPAGALDAGGVGDVPSPADVIDYPPLQDDDFPR